MKKKVLPALILLCIFCGLATYGIVRLYENRMATLSKQHTKSISSTFEVFLKEDCLIKLSELGTGQIHITEGNNKDLRSLVSQLKKLDYQANSVMPFGIPACGRETIILECLCDSNYRVFVSLNGVYLLPMTQEVEYSYHTGIIDQRKKLHKIAMALYQSLREE